MTGYILTCIDRSTVVTVRFSATLPYEVLTFALVLLQFAPPRFPAFAVFLQQLS